jgi:hypothetical protein
MKEAVSISESSVNLYQTTRCNIPEDSHLHTGHRENLKSHNVLFVFRLSYFDYEEYESGMIREVHTAVQLGSSV